MRRRARRGEAVALTGPIKASEPLVEVGNAGFQGAGGIETAHVVDVAQTHVASGAARLSDEIEKKLEDVMNSVPGGIQIRPLIESSIQVALAAALEGLLRGRARA